MMIKKAGNVLGGSLIIAGTGVGAGMLGMPISTGKGGLFASVLLYFICWAVMICTGFIFVEISFWLKDEESNFLTIAQSLLGSIAKRVVAIIYITLFYSLLVAYVAGMGNILSFLMPYTLATLFFVGLLSPFILKGAYFIDRINLIFMTGLFVSYGLFIFFGLPFVRVERFTLFSLADSLPGLPIIFTAFSFQGTIPSLVNYLQRDIRKVRLSIFYGTTIALFIYLVWQALILGIVPLKGASSLEEAEALGQTVIYSLYQLTGDGWVYILGQAFAICAMSTSFLGINMGLVDFLADGLKVEKKGRGLLLIGALVFLPPLIFALSYPKVFLVALHFAGGVGCALLLGVFPVYTLFIGRYIRKFVSKQVFPFGKPTLLFLLLFLLSVFLIEIKQIFIHL